jgi:hypothetical protein
MKVYVAILDLMYVDHDVVGVRENPDDARDLAMNHESIKKRCLGTLGTGWELVEKRASGEESLWREFGTTGELWIYRNGEYTVIVLEYETK